MGVSGESLLLLTENVSNTFCLFFNWKTIMADYTVK